MVIFAVYLQQEQLINLTDFFAMVSFPSVLNWLARPSQKHKGKLPP
jgi:hypothetical protein